jgi:hypothetical protein
VSPIKDLGNDLNYQGYCRSIGDTEVALDQQNAYGWTCVTPSNNHILIDTNALCQWQFMASNVLSRMVNYSDPYDWHCYSHVKILGNVNFQSYCQSLGESAAVDDLNNAYSWHCLASGNTSLVDVNLACRWQYNEFDAIASVSDYNNPNGWTCLGAA